MKQYQYKIQWLLNVATTTNMEDALKIMEILGHRSFDEILFRDNNLEIISTFSTIMYPTSEDKTVKNKIREIIKKDINIVYLEILRK